MICPPHAPAPLVQDWLDRHRHPGSFLLHMVGIPPTLMGVLLVPLGLALASPKLLGFAVALFLGGYLIQFLGHLCDWTEPGELAAIRRGLGRLASRLAARRHQALRREAPGPVA